MSRGWAKGLGDLLVSPRARLLVPLVAVLLTAPSLINGVVLDDSLQRMKARGELGMSLAARMDLFTFVPSDAARKAPLVDLGFVPWFAAHDLRLSFFRPISAALAVFDYTVLDRWPWLMHAESLALYAAVVALAIAAYRRFLPGGTAMLAALLFAIDDAHGIPVGWLANRNAVLGGGFGIAALLAHDRWRRDRWRAGAVLGPLALGAALSSAELAVGTLAYLAAHALTLDPARGWRRAIPLAPYAAVAAVWQLGYRVFGYGARGSGLYLDPFSDPVGFALALPGRWAVLLLAQLGTPPGEAFATLGPGVRAAILVTAVLFLSVVAWVVAPIVRRDASARFFVIGAALAAIPVSATFTSDRLLFLVGFGAFGLVATLIGDLRVPLARAPGLRSGATRALRTVWIALHLILAPLGLPLISIVPSALERMMERQVAPVSLPPTFAKQTLVLVNVPVILTAYAWMFPADPARSPPRRVRALASTTGRVELTREGPRTILATVDPRFPIDPMVVIFRPRSDPMYEGSFAAPGMLVDVVKHVPGFGPTVVRYTFDVDLDDPSLKWVAWDGETFVDYLPPRTGEHVSVGPG